MEILNNEKLEKYTTFKMGGSAKKMYVPETIEDLLYIYKKDASAYKYLIGGGSNLLINDEKEFESVILLKKMTKEFKNLENGKFFISAFISLQELILKINKLGYGGIEYLYSVPGLVGGAIYMNAGRGASYNQNIGQYVHNVKYIKDGEIYTLSQDDCNFLHRYSAFQDMDNIIIIGVEFQFDASNPEELAKKRKERLELCKKQQDMTYPNFGSVFKKSNSKIMKIVRTLSNIKSNKKCKYSTKTLNWMLHGENGTFKQAKAEIEFVKRIHKIFNKECSPEVIIWN